MTRRTLGHRCLHCHPARFKSGKPTLLDAIFKGWETFPSAIELACYEGSTSNALFECRFQTKLSLPSRAAFASLVPHQVFRMLLREAQDT